MYRKGAANTYKLKPNLWLYVCVRMCVIPKLDKTCIGLDDRIVTHPIWKVLLVFNLIDMLTYRVVANAAFFVDRPIRQLRLIIFSCSKSNENSLCGIFSQVKWSILINLCISSFYNGKKDVSSLFLPIQSTIIPKIDSGIVINKECMQYMYNLTLVIFLTV